jgi:transposase
MISAVIAELGDLTRFDKPAQLMAYMGLVPSNWSKGDPLPKRVIPMRAGH